MRLINADLLKSDLVRVVKNGKETYEAVIYPYEIRNAETVDPYKAVLKIIDKEIDFYSQLGKPENQHRDVINAFKDFREEVLALKGEQG